MTNWKAFLTLWLVAVPASVPALAHHGADGGSVYKGSTLLDLTGTVARVEWLNPHVFLFLDVVNAEGKATRWRLELAAPEHAGGTRLDARCAESRRPLHRAWHTCQ